MPRVRFTIPAPVPPERVMAMLTDFSQRRPEIWPTLDRRFYKVHDVDATSADIEEGGPPQLGLWEHVIYTWTEHTVRWTVLESNAFASGSYVDVAVLPDGAGASLLHVEWNRSPVSVKGFLLMLVVVLTKGAILRWRVFDPALSSRAP